MSYLNGISDITTLGALPREIHMNVQQNEQIIRQVLQDAHEFNGLGKIAKTIKKTMGFDEVVERYNRGITTDEIKAWVWYKRSLGIPMTGWEKFFIKGGELVENVETIFGTMIKDNHFRDIRSVEKGAILGKYIKSHDYAEGEKYYIFRNSEGLYYVLAKVCKLVKSSFTTNKDDLLELVKRGAMFYLGGEVVPFPVYTYGNMYDRELQLEKDKESILEQWGQDTFSKHQEAIQKAKPGLLTVTNPDEKERPIITAISDFASDIEVFSISEVREEFMDVETAEELKKVNGKVERKRDKEKINLRFDGIKKYSLQEVFIKWLFTLNADSDFEKSSAIDIADYYLANRALRDDKLTKEEKSELKANARIEGEKLFSRFLHEVITARDQERLDYSWNRIYNGQSDINYKKVPIGFECSAQFKSGILQLTDIQREGIAFMEMMGRHIISIPENVNVHWWWFPSLPIRSG
jgi:hypothetical protein